MMQNTQRLQLGKGVQRNATSKNTKINRHLKTIETICEKDTGEFHRFPSSMAERNALLDGRFVRLKMLWLKSGRRGGERGEWRKEGERVVGRMEWRKCLAGGRCEGEWVEHIRFIGSLK